MRKLEKEELEAMIECCDRYNAQRQPLKEGSPKCDKCGNKRWIEVVEENELKMLPCECQENIKVFGNKRNFGGVTAR